MAAAQAFDASWTAVAETVPLARRSVLDHLRRAATPDPSLNDVGLSVSEAVTNVVHHAYRDADDARDGVGPRESAELL